MSTENLTTLSHHCVGSAESEIAFLEHAFLNTGEYTHVIASPTGTPIILVGKKGTGKSALLQFMTIKSKECNIKTLYLKPDDIPSINNNIGDAQDIATIKRFAFEAIVSAIAIDVGKDLRGLLDRKDKKLFDKAVASGRASNDLVQLALKPLAAIGSLATSIDFSKLLPDSNTPNINEVKEALTSNLSKQNKIFFLLVDDLDQVASPNQSNHVNRIWGFILAIKKISEEFSNIKCVISLRTEIWNQLKNDRSGQRDQVDHVKPLLRFLDPTETEIKDIIFKRLSYVANKIGSNHGQSPVTLFFNEKEVILPSSEETRSWIDFLAKSSRERPRDAIQFLGLLAKEAAKVSLEKINSSIAEKTMVLYSKDRFEDLIREFSLECPSLETILKSFSRMNFLSSTEDLKKHLISVPSICSIIIRGGQLKQGVIEDIFLLWNFLHEIGFINPRTVDSRQTREFRHVLFGEDPNFVSQSNWNEMQKVQWEIHPAYRSYLMKLCQDEKARKGFLASFFNR